MNPEIPYSCRQDCKIFRDVTWDSSLAQDELRTMIGERDALQAKRLRLQVQFRDESRRFADDPNSNVSQVEIVRSLVELQEIHEYTNFQVSELQEDVNEYNAQLLEFEACTGPNEIGRCPSDLQPGDYFYEP